MIVVATVTMMVTMITITIKVMTVDVMTVVIITLMMVTVLPFIIMVIMEGWTIGLTIFAKTAITNGMSPLVFIVYTNALATIILFPCSFLTHQEDRSLSSSFPFC